MRSCIGRVSGPGLSSRNCQSAVCAADKRHERSGGRLWATSRNRGRAYHPLFGALALGSKNIGRLGGTVALLIDRSCPYPSWETSISTGNARRLPGRRAFFALLASVLRLGRDYEAAYRQHTCRYAAAIPRDFADVYVLKFTLFSPRITLLLQLLEIKRQFCTLSFTKLHFVTLDVALYLEL